MPNPVLTIEPWGGLCNRMRALDGAMALARDQGMTLRMIWRLDRSLGCRFDALFLPIPEISETVHIKRFILERKDGIWLRNLLGLWPSHPVLLQHDIDRLTQSGQNIASQIRSAGMHLRTWDRVHGSFGPRQIFKPVPALQAKIDVVTQSLPHAIGLHIRRGDHGPSRTYSPTHLFTQRLETEFSADANLRAFLATDDPETQDTLRAAFGDRIVIFPKTALDRRDPRAIQDATVDLFCLAATRRILGSTGSSFSRMASMLGQIPIERISLHEDEPLHYDRDH